MAFHFRFAPLLRLRQSVERQRALRLQEASLEVSRAQERLARIEQFLADSVEHDHNDLRTGRSAAELQFASLVRENIQHLRQEFQDELRRRETERQRAVEEYYGAYREREVLDLLRARQHRAYQQEDLRREQRQLDAAHLLQRWRNRKG